MTTAARSGGITGRVAARESMRSSHATADADEEYRGEAAPIHNDAPASTGSPNSLAHNVESQERSAFPKPISPKPSSLGGTCGTLPSSTVLRRRSAVDPSDNQCARGMAHPMEKVKSLGETRTIKPLRPRSVKEPQPERRALGPKRFWPPSGTCNPPNRILIFQKAVASWWP